MPTAFVSYSWDNEEHKQWALDLATRLRGDGIETILDQWHTVPGDQLPAFMERSVRDADYVLIICTPRYKLRSDRRQGGVGYEGDIITGEVLTTRNERKFIPILRSGTWTESAPSWLAGKYYIDLSGVPHSEKHYGHLLTTLLGTRPSAPAVGAAAAPQVVDPAERKSPAATSPSEVADSFEPIRLEGVIVDQIGTPRGDGTRGSALYKIPFRLSRRAPSEWAELFVRAWDQPSSFTSMHRPGIARVYGDTVVLDGTTVDEVEEYHRETLLLAVEQANKDFAEFERRRRAAEEREGARLQAHRKSVEDAAKRLRF